MEEETKVELEEVLEGSDTTVEEVVPVVEDPGEANVCESCQ